MYDIGSRSAKRLSFVKIDTMMDTNTGEVSKFPLWTKVELVIGFCWFKNKGNSVQSRPALQ